MIDQMKYMINHKAFKLYLYLLQDIECDELHKRLKELSQVHEALMVEKNQLMENLEGSQQKCQKLVKNMDNEKIVAEKDKLENEVHKLKVCIFMKVIFG